MVAGYQNAKGVGSIAFVKLVHATRRWPALFLVGACGIRNTQEWVRGV